MLKILQSKLKEAAGSILPIAVIILILSMSLVPVASGSFLMFLLGTVFLIVGMAIFTIGAEMSMQQLGMKIGSSVAATGKVWLVAFVSFIIGMVVTISEPDLQILASQVSGVSNFVLILTVSIGVGIFLVFAMLRIVFGVSLSLLLTIFYAMAFALCLFVPSIPDSLTCLAFDSGGVTTGPMTVPFLMALGTGVSSAMSKHGRDDSFGIVALSSVGPILSVLILGIFASVEGGGYDDAVAQAVGTTREGLLGYLDGLCDHMPEVGLALLPILVFSVLFQLITRAFSKAQLMRIGIGVVYTFCGLTLFLTGANIGFVPIGSAIGSGLAGLADGYALLPISAILGYFIVRAEPAVYVLNKQVEQLSAGAISGRTVGLGLSIGVASALALSTLRLIFHIPIMYILIPGYLVAILLTFFVPKIFVGIAFDSGGVASGTMMSAFVLPLSIGACTALGGDVMREAFGCVAFVAMAPIISIQICGLIYRIKQMHRKRRFICAQEHFIDYSSDFIEEEDGDFVCR